MARYKVSWHITIVDADSVLDAAEQANEMRRNDPENEHGILRVLSPAGTYWRVDTDPGFAHLITQEEAERIG